MTDSRLHLLSALLASLGGVLLLLFQVGPAALIWFGAALVWFCLALHARRRQLARSDAAGRLGRRFSRLLLFS